MKHISTIIDEVMKDLEKRVEGLEDTATRSEDKTNENNIYVSCSDLCLMFKINCFSGKGTFVF